MQILVDADACPVKHSVLQLAKKRQIPVTMIMDTSHEYEDGYSRVITVDRQPDSADYALMGLLSRGDIVVTQDYGLAAMVLGKGAYAIHHNGLLYTNENIDQLLFTRHLGKEIRRSGGRTKGPRKRTQEDDDFFRQALERLLREVTP